MSSFEDRYSGIRQALLKDNLSSCRNEEDDGQDGRQQAKTDLFEKVRTSKVLVVGAGGIGCELLKNLVMMGFEDIEIVCFLFPRENASRRSSKGAQTRWMGRRKKKNQKKKF